MCIAHRLLLSTSEISDATASMPSPGYFALQHRVAPPRKAYSLTRRLSSHSAHSAHFPFSNRFLEVTIFQKEQVDLNHVYIDGTKISANAGKYSWVWKKSCEKNRIKLFAKITELLENMNAGAALLGVKFDIREEYAIEYLEEILKKYIELVGFDPGKAVHGKGNHKTSEQRLIEKLSEYIERLKKYAERIKIYGNDRNSYSKTDHDATFMRTTAKNTAWKNI